MSLAGCIAKVYRRLADVYKLCTYDANCGHEFFFFCVFENYSFNFILGPA